jgi:hypothetical protein
MSLFHFAQQEYPAKISVIFCEDAVSHIISCAAPARLHNCSFAGVCYGKEIRGDVM